MKRPQPSYIIVDAKKIAYCNKGDFEGSYEAFLLDLRSRSELAKCDVQTIVIVTITEIIDVISLNCILAIIQSAPPCSLACSCEVSFQCWRACVQYTDAIRIIGP